MSQLQKMRDRLLSKPKDYTFSEARTFLKKIGFEGSGKSEEEAIRIATFNVLVEATMELFRAQNSLKFTKNTLDLFLNGQKSEEK